MRRRFFTRGALVVLIWAAMNATLAFITFAFTANLSPQERGVYFAAVVILIAFSTALLFLPRQRPRSTPTPGGGRAANGAVAPAFAIACMMGGLAWVFGVFLAYLALPLIAFVLSRFRVEWAERRKDEA